MITEVVPANIPEEISKRIQEASLKVTKALGLEVYSRMDFILDDAGKIYCLEANTLPGNDANEPFSTGGKEHRHEL